MQARDRRTSTCKNQIRCSEPPSTRSSLKSSRWRRQTPLEETRRTTHIDISSGSMLCNTVQQDGVPLAWFRWNLFPYSLAEEVRRWFALASFEVKGNWDDLMKKFCERFPMSGPTSRERSARFNRQRGSRPLPVLCPDVDTFSMMWPLFAG